MSKKYEYRFTRGGITELSQQGWRIVSVAWAKTEAKRILWEREIPEIDTTSWDEGIRMSKAAHRLCDQVGTLMGNR